MKKKKKKKTQGDKPKGMDDADGNTGLYS